MKTKAYAKINLTLDVLGKLPSGYHEIESVMQQVDLHDVVFVKKINEGIRIICNNPVVPLDSRNTAYKAAELLIKNFGIKSGVEIKIEKNIPIAAGMSGGSTDAGAVLVLINKIFNLNLSKAELMKLASEIGMDVPFSILGGTAVAKGRGEILEKIKGADFDVLIIYPGFGVSTKGAYASLYLNLCGKNINTGQMITALKDNDLNKIAQSLHNDFEDSVIKKYPLIGSIKQELILECALGSLMSGSGSTVFGIFERGNGVEAFEMLKNKYPFVHLAKTVNN